MKRQIFTCRDPNQVDRLIRAFLDAPGRFLWKEDIRQDVMFDEDAREGSIRTLIYEARKWLRKSKPDWTIVLVPRKGYSLTRMKESQSTTELLSESGE